MLCLPPQAVAQQPVTIALDGGEESYRNIAPFDSPDWRQDGECPFLWDLESVMVACIMNGELVHAESDIWNGEGCRPGVTTHAMLVVGYSKTSTGAYWIAK